MFKGWVRRIDVRELDFEENKEKLRAEFHSWKSGAAALEGRMTRQSQELGQAKAARRYPASSITSSSNTEDGLLGLYPQSS